MKGLDTNVLVRFLIQDDKAQGPKAAACVKEACTPEQPCVLNRIVLCELVWVLESAYGYARPIVAGVIERILRTEEFTVEDVDVAWAALAAYLDSGVDFSDALIGRGNRVNGGAATMTFDRKAAALDDFELLT